MIFTLDVKSYQKLKFICLTFANPFKQGRTNHKIIAHSSNFNNIKRYRREEEEEEGGTAQ